MVLEILHGGWCYCFASAQTANFEALSLYLTNNSMDGNETSAIWKFMLIILRQFFFCIILAEKSDGFIKTTSKIAMKLLIDIYLCIFFFFNSNHIDFDQWPWPWLTVNNFAIYANWPIIRLYNLKCAISHLFIDVFWYWCFYCIWYNIHVMCLDCAKYLVA